MSVMAVAGDLQPAAIDLVLAVARKAGSFGAFKIGASETAKRIRLKIVLMALR